LVSPRLSSFFLQPGSRVGFSRPNARTYDRARTAAA
jgi:hypothetical protein